MTTQTKLRFWEVTLPKPPASMKNRPKWVIIDWVMSETWPNLSGPLMSQDKYIVSADKFSFVFAMKETHEYLYSAGSCKKTFNVRVEYHNAENVCLKRTDLVPRLVETNVHMGELADPQH
jgi:hypothetical protein